MRPAGSMFSRACLMAGLAVLALIWLGPLVSTWRDSFAAHMLGHMGVVAIAAPLLALGLARLNREESSTPSPSRLRLDTSPPIDGGEDTPAARLGTHPLPSRCGGEVSRRSRDGEGAVGAAGLMPRVLPLHFPILASLVELVVVWGWHAPALRALAERSFLATAAEQLMFLGAGLLLWTSCLATARAGDVAHAAAGAFGLLLTTVHMTLLGALLALAPRPLYGAGDVTCFGLVLSSAQDQQLGGVIMLLVGAAVYLAGGLYLLSRVLDANFPKREAAG